MLKFVHWLVISGVFAAAAPVAAGQAPAQTFGPPVTVCDREVPGPRAQPPANSGPVVYLIGPCFEAQGNVTFVDPATYLYYIHLKSSRPSEGVWVPWDEAAEQTALEDGRRLWDMGYLDDYRIETTDYTFANGVIGKIVLFQLEERQRVKIVEYTGSKKVDNAAIDEKLRTANVQIKVDNFIDVSVVKKVENIVRDLLKEKGFPYAEVTHEVKAMPGGPKLAHITFHLSEGPKVKLKHIEFVGNTAMSDGALRGKMKKNKQTWFWSFLTRRGTYHQEGMEEDTARIEDFYRLHGYVRATIGEPEVVTLRDSKDKKTRLVELRIPVAEGNKYKIGDFGFKGNTVLTSDVLHTLFKVHTGDVYNQKKFADGYKRLKDAYGAGGYWDFNGIPNFTFRDDPPPPDPDVPATLAAPFTPGPPIADLTLEIHEGKQYFVNRITFSGNTSTYDNVIRRELRMYESSVFNTEALKYSVRRLNQLGFFRALDENRDVTLEKAPGTDNKVDVTMKLEEQNRNQINFGAGISQFEGFFGQLSFQTANFLGRGESLTVSVQSGSRAQNYSLGFNEPFLFERNISGGFNIFRSDIRYVGQFTQRSSGATLSFGMPLGRGFTRFFTNYSYQRVRVTEISQLYLDPQVLRNNPFLRDSLLIGADGTPQPNGERIISKVTPSIVYNTVDQPIFPTTGTRLSLSTDLAGLGGNTSYVHPSIEAVKYWKQASRLTFGVRGMAEYIHSFKGSNDLPIFERLFLGGEYTIRGFDLRTIGPTDPYTGLVLGGNKVLLFNAEESISLASQVRLIFFYDAGQVRDFGDRFGLKQVLQYPAPIVPPVLLDPFATVSLSVPDAQISLLSQTVSAFKTSTGAEVRFFMPVLNVPFRLIFAYNPQRVGVFDNRLLPQRAFQFRFAVGTTF